MKAVIQRVKKAQVKVGERVVGKIGPGFLLLVGIRRGDSQKEAQGLAEKILKLRIMADEKNHLNKSIIDANGELLVVPQFTLYADTKKGRRPNFIKAAKPKTAKKLIDRFVAELKKSGLRVEKGEFGARMEVELVNDGPVTIILTQERKKP
ncbi:MAG TPA: D-aminoacyl-tRNA deacylase [Candidatus Bathyarchaeia archaeon]|nr:D-aminoacyl-tRNA deacylase [Candidatus Bathyarchaeia archaeon]